MRTLAPLVVCGFTVLSLTFPAFAQGKIYKWVDAQGRVHYSNTPIGQAEDIDTLLPPAASFAHPSAPQAANSPTVAEDTPALPTPPPASPLPLPPADESPPVASLPEEERDVSPPAASEDSPPSEGEISEQETNALAGDETAEVTASAGDETAPVGAFNFTAFDNFLPGGIAEEATSDAVAADEEMPEWEEEEQ